MTGHQLSLFDRLAPSADPAPRSLTPDPPAPDNLAPDNLAPDNLLALQRIFGYPAFRPHQGEAVRSPADRRLRSPRWGPVPILAIHPLY